MRIDEYAECDATALAGLLRDRQVSSDEVYALALNAIAAVDAELGAVASGPWDQPLEFAADGPFAGVPFVIKDLGCHAKGVPGKSGTRLSGAGVTFDKASYLIERFQAAGLAAAALSTAPEFGFNVNSAALAYGEPTRSPWDLKRTAGGSSGGTGALVAAGAVPVGHAGDGGGSIRIPSAVNGVVGLKPSRGRTSDGPECQDRLLGLATEFAITRTIRDCAALLDVAAGAMPGDRFIVRDPERPWSEELGAPAGKLRIALATESWSDVAVDPEVAATVEIVGRRLEELGHDVELATPRFDWDVFVAGMLTIISAFLTEGVAEISTATGNQPGPDTLERTTLAVFEHGMNLSALDLLQGLASLNTFSREAGDFFQEWDLLVTPTVNRLPWPLEYSNANDPSFDAEGWIRHIFGVCSFTAPLNWTGTPALSLPLGWSSGGLPIGIQLAAPMCDEARLIRVGSQLEEAMPWRDRRPSVHAANAGFPAAESAAETR